MNTETFYQREVSGRGQDRPILKEKVALLVIDMQNDFVREGAPVELPGIRNNIPRMRRLIETCREIGVPIIYTKAVVYPQGTNVIPFSLEAYPALRDRGLRQGTEGAEICEDLKPHTEDWVIEKMGYSAFYNTQLEGVLRNLKGRNSIDTVIICGTMTNASCESTARDAFERDYKVIFASDMTSARTDEFQNMTLKNVRYLLGGRVMTSDEIINTLSVTR
jgi:ureidoacrylate peracid hydrolase